ncbi:hypothetical protein TNCV_2104661 [Trichonephila clavipes]|nr:hypothetical protein TNCV_2104661 [Trichonephila clavipes]
MAGTMNVVRFGGVSNASHVGNVSAPNCHPAQTTESVVLFSLAFVGMGANIFLMLLILTKKPLRSYFNSTWWLRGSVPASSGQVCGFDPGWYR